MHRNSIAVYNSVKELNLMKTIIIVLSAAAVLSFILSLFIKTVSFGVFMILFGLFVCYLGFGHQPDRPGMPSAGGGNRDVSPVNQGMMTDMIHEGSRHPVSGNNALLVSGLISIAVGILLQILERLP